MTLLNDAMTILARAQTLAAFAQKYAQYAPVNPVLHPVGDLDFYKPHVGFEGQEVVFQLGLIFGNAGWQRKIEHGSDYVSIFKEIDGVLVTIRKVQLCDVRFEGIQDVTPDEFLQLAHDSAQLQAA